MKLHPLLTDPDFLADVARRHLEAGCTIQACPVPEPGMEGAMFWAQGCHYFTVVAEDGFMASSVITPEELDQDGSKAVWDHAQACAASIRDQREEQP